MQIFSFRDGHVTTFRHHLGAYICQMPGHRLSRLAKGMHTFRVLVCLFVCLGFNGTFSINSASEVTTVWRYRNSIIIIIIIISRHNSRIIYHVGAGDNTNT